MSQLDLETRLQLRDATSALAQEAGAVLMRHFRNLDGYEKKGAIDLVTVADKEAEEAIVAGVRARFPSHAILAEEGGATGPQDAAFTWVIDPLDGTTNFAHGMKNFSTSIAVLHDGHPVAGAVHAPALDELFLAARGEGATLNGRTIRVSPVQDLGDALLVTGFPYNRREMLDWLMPTMGSFVSKAQGLLRLGSAALDLSYVAAGFLEGFYEIGLHPWDMAAGALIVEEAGGRMSTFTPDEPFTIYSKRMVASNGRIHDEMLRVLDERPLA